ncbi:hippurate hydrolase [Azospirillum baldaniorum]|uniref:M20 aminoacylase family protein n=1 Tax=Azospirillum baldaniorum TaxID=1064539 RepID=UPI0011A3F224|nr:M20 aminoacylase family protein [Azospirillum baldaniorum]TWA57362.1 hippurate hydrolase [Azospirillum baldaniorum]
MPTVDDIQSGLAEAVGWRRAFHAHPELGFDERETSRRVAALLASFGIGCASGLAGTGVVGTLRAGNSTRSIGLRAELDALPIEEAPGLGHGSACAGRMHACGHDGHMTMLLGAAAFLARNRRFDGTVHFIFQPAEENLAGGKVMVDEGLFDRFPVDAVYAMHTLPGMPVGDFAVQTGPAMASADMWEATITGRGGHAAHPHLARDPLVAASEIVLALQSVVSRSVPPLESGVLSVTRFQAGDALNVIPGTVRLGGTCRAHRPEVRQRIEDRLRAILAGVCAAHELALDLDFRSPYPPTVNDAGCAAKAVRVATALVGAEHVRLDLPPMMGAEDFAWMLRKRPGCILRIGNGRGERHGAPLHTPEFDFNDDALAYGIAFWASLVEQELAPTGGAA